MKPEYELKTIIIGNLIFGAATAILAKVFFTSTNIVLLSALSINY